MRDCDGIVGLRFLKITDVLSNVPKNNTNILKLMLEEQLRI